MVEEEADNGRRAAVQGLGPCRNSGRSGTSIKDCNSRAVRQSAEIRDYSLFSQQLHDEPLCATGYKRTRDNGFQH